MYYFENNRFVNYFYRNIRALMLIMSVCVGACVAAQQPSTGDTFSLNKQYYLLQNYVAKYDSLQKLGGWKSIPKIKKSFTQGEVDPIIEAVNARLLKEWYLKNVSFKSDSFDTPLRLALEYFQRNHGCKVSGCIDVETIEAMNIPAERRLEQLKVNVERWASMPADLGWRYIIVNVADFKLSVVENNREVLSMKTIVGRYYRKTPTIHSQLSHIVFNPEWSIPENILVKDILPEIRKDSLYLPKHHIRVYRYEKNGSKTEIDRYGIDWQHISPQHIPFVLIQEPGPWNALGQVKFLFQNPYHVYIHDTPAKELFKAKEPIFSSGCIRLSDALGLAAYLLEPEEPLISEELVDVIESRGDNYTIALRKQVPVYIDYFTAWVDLAGNLNFRRDVYNKDVLRPRSLTPVTSLDQE
ncbi:hypothetical protein CNR22_01605 [Sphingobacteriaceae bacterium]|nr:hypothetical protein CNR22_01605 [Sphingobacteriaceae bacterium]